MSDMKRLVKGVAGVLAMAMVVCACAHSSKVQSDANFDTAYILPVQVDTIVGYEVTAEAINVVDSLIAQLHVGQPIPIRKYNKDEKLILNGEKYRDWLFDQGLVLENNPVSFDADGKRYLLIWGARRTATGLATNFYFWYIYDENSQSFREPIWSLSGDLNSFFYKEDKLHAIVVDYSHWFNERRYEFLRGNKNGIEDKNTISINLLDELFL